MPVAEARVQRFAAKASWVAQTRARPGDLGWFMNGLKEPLARLANRENDCTGALTLTDDPGQEVGLWLAPVNDRRGFQSGRVGLVSGFTLSYDRPGIGAATGAGSPLQWPGTVRSHAEMRRRPDADH